MIWAVVGALIALLLSFVGGMFAARRKQPTLSKAATQLAHKQVADAESRAAAEVANAGISTLTQFLNDRIGRGKL